MAVCRVADKKILVAVLSALQILMIVMIGKLYLGSHRIVEYRYVNSLPQRVSVYGMVRNNSVYRHLDILDRGRRESVHLLLIVSSAPKRLDRRNAIRETWWQLCKSNGKVRVLFFPYCSLVLGYQRIRKI